MAEPSENRRIAFSDKCRNFSDLCSIGYYDSRIGGASRLIKVKCDHTFHYLRRGSGVLIYQDKTFHLECGDFFYMPPGVPVAYYPDEQDLWSYYFFHFESSFGARFASLIGLSDDTPVCTANCPENVNDIFDNLFLSDKPAAEFYSQAESALFQILAISPQDSLSYKSAPAHSSIADNTRKIIELNYKNPEFTINSISEILYTNRTYISRMFKTKFKVTPVSYLIDLRLSHAAKLLRQQNMPVKSLSEAVGFSDELYFMKCFKKKFGVTVREYRKQLTSNDEQKNEF